MEIKLTIAERLILANQYKILSDLSRLREDDYQAERNLVNKEIFENGYEGEYQEVFQGYDEVVSVEVSEETSAILNMYNRINDAIELFTPEEKLKLDLDKISFEGFDANNDDHYRYLKFITEKLDKWEKYKNDNLNSHSISSIRKYRRMLDKFKEFSYELGSNLNFEQIRQIVESV